jgi:lipopolysaccharide export system permease protein
LIIDRYLIREIVKPLVVISAILILIFSSYTAERYLAETLAGQLPAKAILYLLSLKVAIALEVLLPTTLYFAVVVALGRLYADSEMTALFSCGVGMGRVLRVVFSFALLVAVLVAGLSLYVRPWAYGSYYRYKAQVKAEFDLARMEKGSFYLMSGEDRLIFAEEIDRRRGRAERVFIHREHEGTLQVISAKEVYQRVDETTGKKMLTFIDGHLYEFPRDSEGGNVIGFQQSTLSLEPTEIATLGYKLKAAGNGQLAASDMPYEIAEYQWRLSTPLSTVLLALLGVPLSRTAPRRGKYAKLAVALLIYAVYYNLLAMARSWVEQTLVGALPGIWWVQVLLAAVLVILLLQSTEKLQSLRLRFRSSA